MRRNINSAGYSNNRMISKRVNLLLKKRAVIVLEDVNRLDIAKVKSMFKDAKVFNSEEEAFAETTSELLV